MHRERVAFHAPSPRGQLSHLHAPRPVGSAHVSPRAQSPTGREVSFDPEEIIVSKTDMHGRITYANDVFMRVAGYREAELLRQPHSIIRHPDMPRCVFKLLWDTIQAGHEIFAYVINLAKNGDAYWVLAHVSPTFDEFGTIIAYHSMRRSPAREKVERVRPIYRALLDEEQRHASKQDAMAASTALLTRTLTQAGMTYEQFVFSI